MMRRLRKIIKKCYLGVAMRTALSFLILLAFSFSILTIEQDAFVQGQKHDCSVSAQHSDLGGSDESHSSTDHQHCPTHCYHFSLMPSKPFKFVAWSNDLAFEMTEPIVYKSPTLDHLTPPPLKA